MCVPHTPWSAPLTPPQLYEPLLILNSFSSPTTGASNPLSRVDIRVRVAGGGHTSQIYAVRQALAKAVVAYVLKHDDAASALELKKALITFDRTLIVADPRRCEPKKFGGPGARARYQSPSFASVVVVAASLADECLCVRRVVPLRANVCAFVSGRRLVCSLCSFLSGSSSPATDSRRRRPFFFFLLQSHARVSGRVCVTAGHWAMVERASERGRGTFHERNRREESV